MQPRDIESRRLTRSLGSHSHENHQESFSKLDREIVSQHIKIQKRLLNGFVLLFFSYPRLTLDFHTNKRTIDEVVRLTFIEFIIEFRHIHLSLRRLSLQNAYATRLPASQLI